MIAPARAAALAALHAIESGNADMPAALATTRSRLPDARDRALHLEIVAGTLRWQRALDHLIAQLSRRPLASLDASVLLILRMSLYQLLHLERVPAAAVVDDAVNLSRMAGAREASGFVNGVLRSALRRRRHLPLPERPAHAGDREAVLQYLGVSHSHPHWLVERWLERYGFENTERWVQFNNVPARITIRVNGLKTDTGSVVATLASTGIETAPTRFATHGLTVTKGNPLTGRSEGAFVVQDEASQLVSDIVGARPGETVLDLCAAPGGKTTALASDMSDTGVLVACDVRSRRMRLLRTSVEASGAHNVQLVHVDGAAPPPFRAVFNRVLVDAPCSGLGTVRRDPDIRWRRTEADLEGLAARQLRLLEGAAMVVAPGGRLFYATCSSEPEENEQVVSAFLERNERFALIDLRTEVPARLHPLLDRHGQLRTLPFAHQLEAFFAAAMVRRG